MVVQYRAEEFRNNIRSALNSAEKGDVVLITRGEKEFELRMIEDYATALHYLPGDSLGFKTANNYCEHGMITNVCEECNG